MKKTVNEEKSRIIKLMEQGIGDLGSSSPEVDRKGKIQKWIKKLHNLLVDIYTDARQTDGYNLEKATAETNYIVKSALYLLEHGSSGVDEKKSSPSNPHETDEYHDQFNKNMTQGFTINEGNAFVGAAKKAREEGKDSFELDGKTYKVTVKKSENKK